MLYSWGILLTHISVVYLHVHVNIEWFLHLVMYFFLVFFKAMPVVSGNKTFNFCCYYLVFTMIEFLDICFLFLLKN